MRIPEPNHWPLCNCGELSDAELDAVVAGKEGGFARKVLRAMYTSSGFYPGSNQSWRTTSDPPPIPPTPVIPPS